MGRFSVQVRLPDARLGTTYTEIHGSQNVQLDANCFKPSENAGPINEHLSRQGGRKRKYVQMHQPLMQGGGKLKEGHRTRNNQPRTKRIWSIINEKDCIRRSCVFYIFSQQWSIDLVGGALVQTLSLTVVSPAGSSLGPLLAPVEICMVYGDAYNFEEEDRETG